MTKKTQKKAAEESGVVPDPPEMEQTRSAKPRGRPFLPGNPGGPGRAKEGPKRALFVKVPDLLIDYRHVYKNPPPASGRESPGRKGLRRMLEISPKTFVENMERMEAEHRQRLRAIGKEPSDGIPTKEATAEAKESQAEGVVTDAGEERVLSLIEEWEESRHALPR